jgi:hypothetical protein
MGQLNITAAIHGQLIDSGYVRIELQVQSQFTALGSAALTALDKRAALFLIFLIWLLILQILFGLVCLLEPAMWELGVTSSWPALIAGPYGPMAWSCILSGRFVKVGVPPDLLLVSLG